MIDSAKLDRYVTIERLNDDSADSFGEDNGDWEEFTKVWAGKNIMKKSRQNTEDFQAHQLVAERKDFFEIRYLTGLHEKMRLVTEEGDIYDIEAIEELGRKEAQRIYAVNKDRLADGK